MSPRLLDSLGGYLHQDYVPDYGSWQGAVDAWASDHLPDEHERLRAELGELLRLGDDEVEQILDEIGVAYSPQAVNQTYRGWIEDLRTHIGIHRPVYADHAIVRWQATRELGQLVEVTSRLFDRLAEIDTTLARWFVPGMLPGRAEVPASERSRFIEVRATARREIPGPGHFIFAVTNGEPGVRSSSVEVMDRMDPPSGHGPGRAVVDLPGTLTTDQVMSVLRSLGEAFGPDIGAVTARPYFHLLDDGSVAGPAMYVPNDRFEIVSEPSHVDRESIGAHGHVLRWVDWHAGDSFDDGMIEGLASAVRRR